MQIFLAVRAAGAIGNQMLALALGYRLYQLTNSAADLGWIGLVQFVPTLLMALPAGHAVDHYSRRRVLCGAIAVDILTPLLVLGAGTSSVAILYVAAALSGASRAFSTPAFQAQLAGLASRGNLSGALALYSTVFRSSLLLGPLIGGFLYGWSPTLVFAAAAGCGALSLLVAMALPNRGAVLSAAPRTLRSAFAGIGYIVKRQELLGVIILDLFGVLLGGTIALLPIYARDILRVGAFGFGVLRASPAIGGLLVGALLVWVQPGKRVGWLVLLMTIAFGLATCGFGLSRHLPQAVLMLALAGAANMVATNIRQTLIQLRTAEGIRGRVSSINAVFISASNQLGQFESGITAYYLGPVQSVLIGGIGTMFVGAAGAALFPKLRRIDRLDELADPSAEVGR